VTTTYQREAAVADEEPKLDRSLPERAGKLLDNLTDGTLLVLKGHLLIEEILYNEVSARLAHPEFLDKANLRFYQLLHLARAIFELPTADEKRNKRIDIMWDGIEALNTLRNRLSHRLEPTDIENLLVRMRVNVSGKPVSLENRSVMG